MFDETHPVLIEAIACIPLACRPLFRKIGDEDHGKIIWATFSDDEDSTRVIFRSYRRKANHELSLLSAPDLTDMLEHARGHGVKRIYLGLTEGAEA